MAYLSGMNLRSLTPEDIRSWHLNAAAIRHACADWNQATIIVSRNLDRMELEKRVAPVYVARCRELMQQGPNAVKAAFLALTDEGQLLRSIHPWAGLLPNAERLAVLHATRRPLQDKML